MATLKSSTDLARMLQAGFGTQLSVVTKRIFQNYWRDPVYFFGKLSNNILAGLYIGTADTFTTR